jgi:mRNA-degrading endonuclease RelE of RelBE toxin-antitoxin system
VKTIVRPAALRALADLPRKDQAAMLEKIAQFAENPFAPYPGAKPLAGSPQVVRIRHRQWRAVCRIDRASDTIIVEAIGDRREIYR